MALLHCDGKEWRRYDLRDGLTDNWIKGIFSTRYGSIWAGTDKGFSRFDGRTWTTYALPIGRRSVTAFETVRQARDGALWINTFYGLPSNWTLRTIRYLPDTAVPNTEIILCPDRVSQPGNTTLAWEGRDPWHATPSEEIQYAWRLDGGEWSPFSHETSRIFQALASGTHIFEVKARDRDFNVDASPAVAQFTVVPPVWQQAWFIILIVLGASVIGYQASRIVLRHRAMSSTPIRWLWLCPVWLAEAETRGRTGQRVAVENRSGTTASSTDHLRRGRLSYTPNYPVVRKNESAERRLPVFFFPEGTLSDRVVSNITESRGCALRYTTYHSHKRR